MRPRFPYGAALITFTEPSISTARPSIPLLCTDRSESAARAFFGKALETNQNRRPRKINLDGNAATHRALRQAPVFLRPWQADSVLLDKRSLGACAGVR
jgi:hypothetical protein